MPALAGTVVLRRTGITFGGPKGGYHHQQKVPPKAGLFTFAERVGFEPTVPLRIHYLSRVANSTTLAPLQSELNNFIFLQPVISIYSFKE